MCRLTTVALCLIPLGAGRLAGSYGATFEFWSTVVPSTVALTQADGAAPEGAAPAGEPPDAREGQPPPTEAEGAPRGPQDGQPLAAAPAQPARPAREAPLLSRWLAPELWLPLLGSCAWPLVTLLALLLFRRQLATALGRLAKVSISKEGIAAEFRERLGRARRTVPTPRSLTIAPAQAAAQEFLVLEAEVSPQAAIHDAWTRLWTAANQFLERRGVPRRETYRGLAPWLAEHIGPERAAAFAELRRLQRLAKRAGSRLTAEDARGFVQLAGILEAHLREETDGREPHR